MATPRRAVRRFRTQASRVDPHAKARKQIDGIMDELIALDSERIKVDMRIAETVDRIQAALDEAGLKSHEYADWIAEYREQKGNTTREVDPLKLYNKLSEKDFFACVKVSLSALENVLTETEINSIAKVTPGKVKGTKFTVARKPKTAKGRS